MARRLVLRTLEEGGEGFWVTVRRIGEVDVLTFGVVYIVRYTCMFLGVEGLLLVVVRWWREEVNFMDNRMIRC